jgi:hypothetical protein
MILYYIEFKENTNMMYHYIQPEEEGLQQQRRYYIPTINLICVVVTTEIFSDHYCPRIKTVCSTLYGMPSNSEVGVIEVCGVTFKFQGKKICLLSIGHLLVTLLILLSSYRLLYISFIIPKMN